MSHNLFEDLFNPVVLGDDVFLRKMQELCKVSHELLMEIRKEIRPDITTEFLARRLFEKVGSAGKGQYRLEHVHISVNEQVFHCSPSSRVLMAGDIFTLDIVLSDGELFSDGAWTYGVDELSLERSRLLVDAWAVSRLAAQSVRPGEPLSCMQGELAAFLKGREHQIVPEACGHGVGRKVHDDPEIPFISDGVSDPLWPESGCVTVEPVLVKSCANVIEGKDLSFVTSDGSDAAYFEHLIYIGSDEATCLNIPEINITECVDIF